MTRLNDIIVDINYTESMLREHAVKRLKIKKDDIKHIDIIRRSIDARRGIVRFCFSINVYFASDEIEQAKCPNLDIDINRYIYQAPPVIIGAGPAGLFAALVLALNGYNPILIERGEMIDERKEKIYSFNKGNGLDFESNVYFGEGGAGTFSDGKLVTRINDPKCAYVLNKMVEYGAPSDILIDAKAHIGTDVLQCVIVNIRKAIIAAGGKILFKEKLIDITKNNNKITQIQTNNNKIDTDALILATGHGARDIYALMKEKNITMISKAMAIGFRIEHPREVIDKAVYGEHAGNKLLGSATYNLKAKFNNSNIFSFCMCPGGIVINSSSEKNALCINGMSYHARDGANSNAAIVTQIKPSVWGDDPFAGIEYQRKLEQKAYILGEGGYAVPAQRVCDFMDNVNSKVFDEVKPSALPKVNPSNLRTLLDEETNENIKSAINYWERRIQNYSMGGAVLSAIESRTSSPVRILRNETYESVSLEGLYPCGEGAGYAGGIMSAAVDGIRCAISILEKK